METDSGVGEIRLDLCRNGSFELTEPAMAERATAHPARGAASAARFALADPGEELAPR
ncbi:hypothetical protein AB0J74_37490 [Asanoa sp. NPDC049573]|uniref:hypothetical protein n=1 Tax=Asanoa sp. NPDC049573 TaxID=3155396 RepID=UPI003437AEEA